jgi:DNA-binding GntR family transcriptional regulator
VNRKEGVDPDDGAAIPTYLQLAAKLADQCQELPGGTRLPSENELVAANGVSRITARAALQELEQRHVVRRQRGSGTFVANRIPYVVRAGMPPSWSAIVASAGHEPDHRLLSVETVRASAAVARALLLPRGRSVVQTVRLGLVDGVVASHQVSHLPSALVPDIARRLERGSLTSLLIEEYGLEPDRWWSRAEMATVPADIGGELEVTGRPMAWRIQSVNVCRRRGVPVEVTTGWMRADQFDVALEFGPTDGAQEIGTTAGGTGVSER